MPVDSRAGNSVFGATALFYAASSNKLKAAKALLKAGADVFALVRDGSGGGGGREGGKGRSALDVAKEKGYGEMVQVLDGFMRGQMLLKVGREGGREGE